MDNKKNENFSEWFTEIIQKAELADIRYNLKGFIVFRPWSVLSIEEMYKLYEKELQSKGHKPTYFPILIPESNFHLEASHVEGFSPEVFWVTEHGKGEKFEERLALRPTSETAMYKMYSLWIQGKSDLPLKIYQRGTVYRYETKATRPFFRSRELVWIEAHNCFATKKEAVKQVKEDLKMTEKVMYGEFCIPFIGFQRPEWDKFPGAVHTYAADTLMPDGKVIQMPSTHLLGQNFSKPFNVMFADEKGKQTPVWQTCHGPCISRIYGGMISILGDDQGLRLPFKLAPVQVIIVPILKGDDAKNKAVLKYCKKIQKKLIKKEFRTEIDSSENTPGFKFNQWEMKGVPIRFEIGPKEFEQNKITLSIRTKKQKETIDFKDIVKIVKNKGEEVTKDLKEEASKNFLDVIHDAKNMNELKQVLDKGGFARIPFCSVEMEGRECADNVKAETHGDIRGIRVDSKEKPNETDKCIWCGKSAKEIVYIARQY
ncbi:proline--tRNA ligase [Candidatus Micrarchaeota archaeon]|nr:proline--tRNA ligase [Candidatus Micrarchaeota archaeon]